MNKIDEAISNVAYILGVFMAYRNITELGNCNTCKISKDCKYAPPLGTQVRYNCPFFSGRDVETLI